MSKREEFVFYATMLGEPITVKTSIEWSGVVSHRLSRLSAADEYRMFEYVCDQAGRIRQERDLAWNVYEPPPGHKDDCHGPVYTVNVGEIAPPAWY